MSIEVLKAQKCNLQGKNKIGKNLVFHSQYNCYKVVYDEINSLCLFPDFKQSLPLVTDAINNATFLAIDAEFSGQ